MRDGHEAVKQGERGGGWGGGLGGMGGGHKWWYLVALDEVLLLLHISPQIAHFCFTEGHLTGTRQLCLGVPPLQGLHRQHEHPVTASPIHS